MKITLNGKDKQIKKNQTIKDFFKEYHLEPNSLVVEINGKIFNGLKAKEISVFPGDKIEFISFFGGG